LSAGAIGVVLVLLLVTGAGVVSAGAGVVTAGVLLTVVVEGCELAEKTR
jgi:hypothetical protein